MELAWGRGSCSGTLSIGRHPNPLSDALDSHDPGLQPLISAGLSPEEKQSLLTAPDIHLPTSAGLDGSWEADAA